MRTTITVTGLTMAQWDYVTTEVPVDGRNLSSRTLLRACVVFELAEDAPKLHIEMDVAEFIGLMIRLATLVSIPVLIPDVLPTLPTADQVRNLSAAEALKLFRSMNSELT